MNDPNALVFCLIGSAMELLSRAFPSWFPPTGGDQSSARALWLAVMGAVQIGLGAAHLVRAHAAPAAIRIFSAISANGRDPLALPHPRPAAGR
jgi:hypothetical protein